MATTHKHTDILLRDGVSQHQRFIPALDGATAKLDGRSLPDLMAFALDYAKEINFFGANDPNNEQLQKWEKLFNPKQFFSNEQFDIAAELDKRSDFPPQYALFLTFIKLFQYAQGEIDNITGRHLDFYYNKVLGLSQNKGLPDEVHVIFELAKSAAEQQLKAGTLLDTGMKDEKGNKVTYTLTNEEILNTGIITDIRSVYVEPDTRDLIRYATVANSKDGLGEKLDPTAAYWKAFGHKELPATKIGFALASPVLLLREGARTITTNITISGTGITLSEMRTEAVEIFYTGEKAWVGPIAGTVSFASAGSSVVMKIAANLDDQALPVLPYNAAVHGGAYATEHPVLQFRINTARKNNLYRTLINAVISNISITTRVEGITSLDIENDNGKVNVGKPFQPFGAQPVVGSSLYINYPELDKKFFKDTSFNIEWQAIPSDLAMYYDNYFDGKLDIKISRAGKDVVAKSFADNKDSVKRILQETKEERINISRANITKSDPTKPRIDNDMENENFKADLYVFGVKKTTSQLFNSKNAAVPVVFPSNPAAVVSGSLARTPGMRTQFRWELLKDFRHSDFPRRYAVALHTTGEVSPEKIPADPYTPVIKSISFNYTGYINNFNPGLSGQREYTDRQIQFFHLDVFGEAEQHGYLKAQAKKIQSGAAATVSLLPQYRNEGNLYLGIEKLLPGQTLSCLFQLLEGSADPRFPARNIVWSVLSGNEWFALSSEQVVTDATNQFLRSGIIKFAIPANAGIVNTVLPSGKIWLRGEINEKTEAVCQCVNLHTQAVRARYNVSGSEIIAQHSIPGGTISKMTDKLSAIKKVEQPYASFGGKAQEAAPQFYTRVSERLRHKQRAITPWDYERLVLEQFPEVYKVKCLSHSSNTGDCCGFRQPGHVTLVAIPDLKNRNSINPFEPRLSLDTITAINNFLSRCNSMFVTVRVQNPEYEKVKIRCSVRFKSAGNFDFQARQLAEDIKRFMAPWAFDTSLGIRFGGRVQQSLLMNFMEELSYVDFITTFSMEHIIGGVPAAAGNHEIVASSPAAILVPNDVHLITEFDSTQECT
jgi:Baseplate J-like protein